ncbi:MAG: hypothetical protein ACRDPM_27630 [Solirubrobacteraceae bacterium]
MRKKNAGSASSGHVWENDGDVVEVHDHVGVELLERRDGEFEEVEAPAGAKSTHPPEEAEAARAAREVREVVAASETAGTTRLQDGRWAQTDTKGDPILPEVRDTGNEEMGPANVTRRPGHPRSVVTPGSAENKQDKTADRADREDREGKPPAVGKPVGSSDDEGRPVRVSNAAAEDKNGK